MKNGEFDNRRKSFFVPSTWVKPLATKQALYCSMVPSKLYLILYIQQQPIGLYPGGRETICHVLLRSRA